MIVIIIINECVINTNKWNINSPVYNFQAQYQRLCEMLDVSATRTARLSIASIWMHDRGSHGTQDGFAVLWNRGLTKLEVPLCIAVVLYVRVWNKLAEPNLGRVPEEQRYSQPWCMLLRGEFGSILSTECSDVNADLNGNGITWNDLKCSRYDSRNELNRSSCHAALAIVEFSAR